MRVKAAPFGYGSAMASLSTHVLDLARGLPAAGVRVELASLPGGEPAGQGVTGPDGRIAELATGLGPGAYQLSAHVGDYFRAAGSEPFVTELLVRFQVTDPGRHHHVPVLATPFAASTYLGS